MVRPKSLLAGRVLIFWALMVAGFGLAGAAMRRQRAIVRFA